MSEKITKVAYNYIDDMLEKLRQTMGELSVRKPFNPKTYNDLETRFRVLQQKRFAPYQESNLELQQASAALAKAKGEISQDLAQSVDDTSRMSPFNQWENKGGIQQITKVPNNDPTQPEWVSLPDLKFMGAGGNRPSQFAQYIKTQMGDALFLQQKGNDPKWPDFDTYIRGTAEAWSKFTELAPYVFDNVSALPTAKSLGLKSEKAYNPEYADDNSGAVNKFPLIIEVINQGKQDHWEVGLKKNEKAYKPAIRLRFDPKDDNFFHVSGLAVNELQMQSTRTNRSSRTIDIYDMDAPKLLSLSQKLQQSPYKYEVKPLNEAITQLTGQAVGDVKKKISDKVKAAPLSEKVVQNRLASNVFNVPVDRAAFDQEIQQLYPGAFNPQFVTPQQAQAQKDGMFFILGRGTSILADEPGAGKTAQSLVGADYATALQDREAAQQAAATGQQAPPQKKILVFTPLPLVEEHWVSSDKKQAKPSLYMGQDPNNVSHVRSHEDFANVGDHTRWVVIPYTTMSQAQDRNKIAMQIAADSKAGKYGAVILDEIQMIKKLDSNQGEALRMAISAGGIKHRIGLTGTPADNDPADLYKQLRVTRHPILYDTEGKVQQTEKGFATQFLGGEAYADKDARSMSRLDSIFTWAKQVNKELLVQLFSTTYIRRTKEDMKPELPKKTRNNAQVIPGQEAQWSRRLAELQQSQDPQVAQNPWQPLEGEMAMAKVPYTVKSAIDHLQNPQNKCFVVTKYPEVAIQIAQQINAALGDGTAAEVYGDAEQTVKNIKKDAPNAFKAKLGTPESVLKGKRIPLRCVVYTMKMGAVGLNFAVANKAIFNDIDWNPSNNLQAEDRVHRIDSPHAPDIEYIYFAGTYDQQMFSRVRRKEAVNKEINDILRAASLNPESANQIAGEFVMKLVDSMLFDIHMKPQEEAYAEQKKEQLRSVLGIGQPQIQPDAQPIAASTGSWYTRFKTASLAHRHLW